MEEKNWYEKLTQQAKQDHHNQVCLAEVKGLEPAFLALRDALSEEQQKILEGYLSACEELDHALVVLARQNE